MAEAPIDRLPSGFGEDFVNVVEEDLQCLICHLPLKEPVQTRCGHRFCKECLEEHFSRQRHHGQPYNCPAEREVLDRDRDVFPDKATERKILSFAIKCPSEGCEWTGELRSKEAHLASCLFKLVSCTNENCHVTVQRGSLKEHLTTCQWRILYCDHCREPHPECQMKDHIGECSKFLVTCPNSCGGSFHREMIPNHTQDDCPLTVISCPYEQMGCETKVQRKQVESHLQSAMRLHLDLACVKLNNTEVKLKDTDIKLNEAQVKLNNTEVKLINTEKTTKRLMEKLDTLQRQLTLKLNGTEVVLNDTQEKLDTTRKLVDTRVFIWKINNFSSILREAKDGKRPIFESAPFYTDKTENYGYKLKVNVYPNGSGLGKNTHLSVFIFVMKGEYDAILHWPFEMKVKFTIIDQQEDPAENVTQQFVPDILLSNFARPVNAQNMGRGFDKFISHEKLHSRRYVVDDVLFLQVEISP